MSVPYFAWRPGVSIRASTVVLAVGLVAFPLGLLIAASLGRMREDSLPDVAQAICLALVYLPSVLLPLAFLASVGLYTVTRRRQFVFEVLIAAAAWWLFVANVEPL